MIPETKKAKRAAKKAKLDHIETDLRSLAIAIDGLAYDPHQAQHHDERSIAEITRSLRAHGQKKPIVVQRDGMVVKAGNGTLQAARELGWTHIAAVVSDDPETALREFALRDNRTAQLATWDTEVLFQEIDYLGGVPDDFGWTEYEFADLQPETSKTPPADPGPQIDMAEELREKWGVETGQLWELGEHRLLCGDATRAEESALVMGEEKAKLMLTDPPYGVDYGALVKSRKNQKKAGWNGISGDEMDDESLLRLLGSSLQGAGALVAFIWHPAGARRRVFWSAVESLGWRLAQEIVWVKNSMVFGRADYQWRHEPCMYLKRNGAPRQHDRTQTTVWEVNKPHDSQHPTMKPVELFVIPTKNHTEKGDIVLDPFLGFGTTLIACEQLNRRCRAIEIDPGYVAVALQRWADMTGKTPKLIS